MNTKTILACSAAVIAFALIVAPSAMSVALQGGITLAKKTNKNKNPVRKAHSR